MSLHKLTAGDGYTYLTRQVAALDTTERGYGSLGDYYAQRGESPGVWMGRGLVGLSDFLPPLPTPGGRARASPGAAVSEAQMLALFGEGRHPDAAEIERHLTEAGHGPAVISAATRLGSPYVVRNGATPFRTRTAAAYGDYNAGLGFPRDWPVRPQVRARIRTEVADAMFAEEYGRAPLDARERSGFIARASRAATTAVAGYDLTFSPVKSVSALWAIAPLPVMRAVEAAHHAAVADALAWLEDHAAFTRLGRGGVQQVDVRGLLAVAFTHRDSRAGDPDLHTHVAISNKVQSVTGRWLALDGRPLHKLAVAASERYNTRLEAELVSRLGVRFAARRGEPGKRPVRELVGFDQPGPRSTQAGSEPTGSTSGAAPGSAAELLAAWSSRRAAIEVQRAALAARFQADHGRPPTPVEAVHLAQQATLETRQAKHAPRTHSEQRAAWRQQAIDVLGGEHALQDLVHRVLTPRPPPASGWRAPGWVAATAARVLDTVQAERATWQPGHLIAEAQRVARSAAIPLADVDAAVGAVVAHATGASIALGGTDPVIEPPPLRRRDGTSVYTVAGTQLYTSAGILAAEQLLVDVAGRGGGRRCGTEALEQALTSSGDDGIALNPGQIHLVTQLARSGAQLALALAPAGTGKTTALSVLARAWRADGGTVLGLAPSAAAAAVLRTEIAAPTDTLAKLLHSLPQSPDRRDRDGRSGTVPDWVTGIGPDTLVLIDEAGMASTLDLAAAVTYLTGRGASVRLIGDDRQLSAVGAGGVLRDIADVHGAVELSDVVRFTDPAEAAASLALRDGDPAALGFVLDHGRVHVGDPATAADQAFQVWAADIDAGKDAVLLAATRDQVAALNARAQADRLARQPGAAPPTVPLGDGSFAGLGDVVTTRANNRRLPISATDWVKNGDRWTVTHAHPDGALDVTHLVSHRRAHLPASYVAEHVTLGYATTIHAAQGTTAQVSHTVLTGQETRRLLYVAATRGRAGNHLYLAVAGDGEPHTVITPDALRPPTATDLLTRILGRDDAHPSATTTARQAAAATRRLAEAAARYTDALATAAVHHLGPDWACAVDAAARQELPGLTDQPAWPALQAQLAFAALDGHDPIAALRNAISIRELDSADDVAAVLHWRLDSVLRASYAQGADVALPGARAAPLPWLAGVPAALATDPEWGTYLRQRADLVTNYAAEVTAQAATWSVVPPRADGSPANAPRWALPLLARPTLDTDPTLLEDLALWRAAVGVDDGDLRPIGAPSSRTLQGPADGGTHGGVPGAGHRTVAETQHQRRLDARVHAVLQDVDRSAARWAALAARINSHLTQDPTWHVLAEQLTAVQRAGIDAETLLLRVAAERPLPDEYPAAALRWRLTRHLPTPLTPEPVADAVEAPTDGGPSTPPPQHKDSQPAEPGSDSPNVNDGGADPDGVGHERILQLNAQALDFFITRYGDSWAPAYLAERLGADLAARLAAPDLGGGDTDAAGGDDRTFSHELLVAGYAPAGWTTLVDHLRHLGAADEELLAAGLATRGRTGTLIDRFRDRLILPIRADDGIRGFIARRNPAQDRNLSVPKYLNTPETSTFRKGELLYGLAEASTALANGARPVLVEGPLDALAVTHATDHAFVGVAPLGTAFTDAQADLLRPYLGPDRPGTIVATDADAAGRAAAERAYWHLIARHDRPRRLVLPDGLDPADHLRGAGRAALRDALANPIDLATVLVDQCIDAHSDTLHFAEGRVAAARSAATVIGALPPQDWASLIDHVVARTGILPTTAGLMTFDAGQAWGDDRAAALQQQLSRRLPAPIEPKATRSSVTPAQRSAAVAPDSRHQQRTHSPKPARPPTPPATPGRRPTPPPIR